MIIVSSDKTSNLYYMNPNKYKKLMKNSITSEYSIDNENTINIINNEAADILRKQTSLKNKRVPKYEINEAFITIKDHKTNFPHDISCRTINSSKTHLGKLSKAILQKHIAIIRKKSMLRQWKNSDEVIEWFEKIENKNHKCFVSFDIKSFYPTIKRKHLIDAINFSEPYSKFSDFETDVILHTCKSIMFYDHNMWKKSNNNDNFDVPMGSFHGAEVCDLVGLYLLNNLTTIIDTQSIGLYRDDGLAIIKQTSKKNICKIKEKIARKLSEIGFDITISAGETSTNFLDIHLNLLTDDYCPYIKPNAKTIYIDKDSNHPRTIKKNIPKMIENRISKLTKNKVSFNNAIQIYQNALNKSNFNYKLKYNPTIDNTKAKNRKRKCIFYNPPFCESVKTKFGKLFLELLDKHFPKSNELHKIFNRNSIKISYCCSPNIKAIISGHNKKLLNKPPVEPELCNCKDKKLCPVSNKCKSENVIYEAIVTSVKNDEKMSYIGSTRRPFKNRLYEHRASFPKPSKKKPTNCTQLANYIWKLYNKGEKYTIEWKILRQANSKFKPNLMCQLCNLERLCIANANQRKILNKRNELVTQCPHYPREYF